MKNQNIYTMQYFSRLYEFFSHGIAVKSRNSASKDAF